MPLKDKGDRCIFIGECLGMSGNKRMESLERGRERFVQKSFTLSLLWFSGAVFYPSRFLG